MTRRHQGPNRRDALAILGVAGCLPAISARADTVEPVGQVQFEKLWLGSAWYPEQWDREHWGRDLDLMRDAGFNVVRMGEFAWSRMEPEESRFDLDWLEQAVTDAAERGVKTVLGTPSDTPPAWMTSKYPDVVRIDPQGRPIEHGGRRQFSISSPRYREFCARIVTEMGRRFGANEAVIGWQIGNEYTDESYEPLARQAFQQWLRDKYQSLDALNLAWTAAYWSQTYFSWDEIPFNAQAGNPGWMLDCKRFITDTWVDFQQNQVDALKATVRPRQFITTNLGGLGWANRFNRADVSRPLDFISWDNYVGQGHLEPYRNGATHDLVRGWKRKNFWVMEIQPGAVNWAPVSNMLYKGETRAMAWHAVGHGSDGILYWQWRSALNGQEQYHGCIVGPDGEPQPIYTEVQRIGRDFAKASASLRGTSPVSEVALLHDYDSRWAIDFQKQHRDYDPVNVLVDWYRPLQDQAQSVDILEPRGPLGSYKAIFAPNLNIITEDMARLLIDYVRAGGRLVLGPRSGMKDSFNRLRVERQPGPLVGILGAHVDQFYPLDETVEVVGEMGSGQASLWAETLELSASDVRVLLRYGQNDQWFSGRPAAVARPLGRGEIVYLGAVLDADLMDRFTASILEQAGVEPVFGPVPAGVEVTRRRGEGRDVFILVNHSRQPQSVVMPGVLRDVLADAACPPILKLEPEGVAILERPAL